MTERTNEAAWERIRDDLPESFWKVATWLPSDNYVTGALDVADRKRIGMAIIEAATSTSPPAHPNPEPPTGDGGREGVGRRG